MKILLAEDDRTTRLILAATLKKMGARNHFGGKWYHYLGTLETRKFLTKHGKDLVFTWKNKMMMYKVNFPI